jgi:CheY-like chemotaxis protein
MPVMSGMEATRAIRKLELERQQKPAMIIAVTALGSASIQQEAFSNGINMFLTKPLRFRDLRRILNEWTPEMEPQSHET